MSDKVEAIILGTIRHSDKHNIISVYSRDRGRMSFISPIGNGRSARLRNGRLLPLSIIETDIRTSPSSKLVTLGQFASPITYRSIYFSTIKQALTLFLQEFLEHLTRSAAPDPSLYDYIKSSILYIDLAPAAACANLHIAFLVGLLDHMGIFPNLEGWTHGDMFDMRGGEFIAHRPLHNDYLGPAEAAVLPILGRITMRNAALFRFSADERRSILSNIIRYYSVHYPGLGNLKSIDVLREVFH